MIFPVYFCSFVVLRILIRFGVVFLHQLEVTNFYFNIWVINYVEHRDVLVLCSSALISLSCSVFFTILNFSFTYLISFNPLKCSGVRQLQLKVFNAIPV